MTCSPFIAESTSYSVQLLHHKSNGPITEHWQDEFERASTSLSGDWQCACSANKHVEGANTIKYDKLGSKYSADTSYRNRI
ncbi:hypothetical protein CY34DRAFT_799904 [Suillus luteus UH-Slu-Lm8-n1]|uniref:Uncharacterized protein n=1 Tax=Suillus luteus UH-Slu-Lm8-n1 TaxID=930992 RepID=A0A0D0BB13_9AGAM|nr:hypothetical protein CY34DRAFT_799904 [Suillus luteus UH-Slu-Lm8-n1]